MRAIFTGFVVTLLPLSVPAGASEAAFSGDGTHLWVLSKNGTTVYDLKTDGSAAAGHPLNLPGTPANLLSDPDGLLIATDDKLWRWKPDAPPVEVAPLPPSFHVQGISRAEGGGFQGAILINGEDFDEKAGRLAASLYCLLPGEKTFRAIFTRHVWSITACPAFAGGRMVFGADQDLWEGGLERYGKDDERAGFLWGYRTTPLASAYADEGNGEGKGTRTVAIAGGRIWIALTGHHAGGTLASVPFASAKPATPETLPGGSDIWALARKQLADTRVVKIREDAGSEAFDGVWDFDSMCAWSGADGQWKIAFRTLRQNLWLLEKGAEEPRKIGSIPRD